MSLPQAHQLVLLNKEELTEAIGLLFEPCPTLVEFIQPVLTTNHTSWSALIDQIRHKLHTLAPDDERTSAIVAAHPRLGAKKVDSQQSRAEQASLKSPAREAEELAALNEAYERHFPGLRYVVFVNGRSRSVIMENMKDRIAEGNYAREVTRAFDAMCDIALDRAVKLGENGKVDHDHESNYSNSSSSKI